MKPDLEHCKGCKMGERCICGKRYCYGECKVSHLPKQTEDSELSRKMAHDTKDGWCCACRYDIAVLEDKLSSQLSTLIKEVGEIKTEIKEKEGGKIEDWTDVGKVSYYYIDKVLAILKDKMK